MARSSKHSAVQEIEICFNGYVLPVEVHIDYTYHPAVPATPPSYASGGDPPEGAGVEIIRTVLWHEGKVVQSPKWLEDFVDKSLHDDPAYLIERASDDRMAEEDEAADFKRRQRRDDKLTGGE